MPLNRGVMGEVGSGKFRRQSLLGIPVGKGTWRQSTKQLPFMLREGPGNAAQVRRAL